MSPPHPQPRRTPCSAKSHRRKRKSCAHKELQFHGVEDGHGSRVWSSAFRRVKTVRPSFSLSRWRGAVFCVGEPLPLLLPSGRKTTEGGTPSGRKGKGSPTRCIALGGPKMPSPRYRPTTMLLAKSAKSPTSARFGRAGSTPKPDEPEMISAGRQAAAGRVHPLEMNNDTKAGGHPRGRWKAVSVPGVGRTTITLLRLPAIRNAGRAWASLPCSIRLALRSSSVRSGPLNEDSGESGRIGRA
jgi:hypothetical protein